MILVSKMAITFPSFYKGIQPLTENLKTNTCKNENKLQLILIMLSKRQQVSLVSQTHPRAPQSAGSQHSVGEPQAL